MNAAETRRWDAMEIGLRNRVLRQANRASVRSGFAAVPVVGSDDVERGRWRALES